MKSPMTYFANIRDSRVERTREHDMEEFGKAGLVWKSTDPYTGKFR
jgi:hypothetical protein